MFIDVVRLENITCKFIRTDFNNLFVVQWCAITLIAIEMGILSKVDVASGLLIESLKFGNNNISGCWNALK